MALDKENENYYYNLGRTVALVEIMNGLDGKFMIKVFDNAFQNLPHHLKKALFNDKHNLHKELLEPADVVLMHGEIPHGILTEYDISGSYAIGYYHEKAYLDTTYHGVYGKVETEVVEHIPERIDSTPEGMNADWNDNIIEELRRSRK